MLGVKSVFGCNLYGWLILVLLQLLTRRCRFALVLASKDFSPLCFYAVYSGSPCGLSSVHPAPLSYKA